MISSVLCNDIISWYDSPHYMYYGIFRLSTRVDVPLTRRVMLWYWFISLRHGTTYRCSQWKASGSSKGGHDHPTREAEGPLRHHQVPREGHTGQVIGTHHEKDHWNVHGLDFGDELMRDNNNLHVSTASSVALFGYWIVDRVDSWRLSYGVAGRFRGFPIVSALLLR